MTSSPAPEQHPDQPSQRATPRRAAAQPAVVRSASAVPRLARTSQVPVLSMPVTWFNMLKKLTPLVPWMPLVLGMIVFSMFMRSFVLAMASSAQGHLIYTLDDAYIHMAIAKNLALYGVWGNTPYAFSSSSSSPLWTLLLAAIYRVLGSQEIVPFVLNMLCSVLVFALLCYALQRRGVAPLFVAFIPLAILLVTPFMATALTGMEHILHALFTLLFLHLALELFPNARLTRGQVLVVALTAALMIGARYESIFLLVLTCGLLVLRGRFVLALIIGGAGSLPMVAYGIISLSHGWNFVPNSLILKSEPYDFGSFDSILRIVRNGVNRLMDKPELMVLLFLMIVAFLVRQYVVRRFWNDRASVGLLLVILSVFLHRTFVAEYSPYNRYDSYLFVLGLYALGLALSGVSPGAIFQARRQQLPTYAALVMFIVLFGFVGYIADTERDAAQIGGGSRNIYAQQYQMGRFIHAYYDQSTVALNDIGAVSYLSNAHIADLFGLASNEVAYAKIDRRYDNHFIDSFVYGKNVRLAIVYDSWFSGLLPPSWTKVATWDVSNSGILGDGTVTFYAAHPEDAPTLAANLTAFSASLPPDTRLTMIDGTAAAE